MMDIKSLKEDFELRSIHGWIDGIALDEIIKLIDLFPKELKHKKDIPTVIEYQGRRYVLDMQTPKKTYTKDDEEWERRFYDND